MSLSEKMARLVLALRAREALENVVRRQTAPSYEYEAWQREALWDSYPLLSVLAYEIEGELSKAAQPESEEQSK